VLKEKIEQDFKSAFKEKREAELSTLKMLKAALLNKEKEKQYQESKAGGKSSPAVLTDDEIIGVVGADIKKLRDAITLFEQGGRVDLVKQNQAEIETLMRYMPAQMGEAEVKKLVQDAIKESGATCVKEMGKVMAVLMPKVKGKADSTLVSRLVKEALSQMS
jgi:uncharacterized protein YqeY